ncbi:tyrosine-protein phosphatase 69D isoform X3 [Zerene cesonia]|uniref:tyrosine-protein phosphatase 69D isoform X3 n=1 Tax=Zerene cesonia TaxID=33412 RepID=UPI0018E50B5B|nr:tyrosine-protein phosphatase 69D isoform X3 [Zerene cesonia]
MTMVHLARKCSVTFALYFGCIALCYPVLAQDAPEILDLSARGALGNQSNVSCSMSPSEADVEWMFNGEPVVFGERIKQYNEERLLHKKDLDGNQKKYKLVNITIANTTADDDGNFTCIAKLGDARTDKGVVLNLSFPGKLVRNTPGPIKQNVSDQANVTMECVFEVFKPGEVKWWKRAKDDEITELTTKPASKIGLKQIQSIYDLHIRSPEDNGTYVCQIFDTVTSTNISGNVDIIVYAPPQVLVDTVIPISASQLFLNWTVRSYNSPIKTYNLMYRKLPSTDFSLYTREKIGVKNISFVMEGLEKSTKYQLKLEVTTMHGQSKPHIYESTVRTLDKDPIFVPNIAINGFSATSVTIGWAPPPEDIAELIHYYLLEARKMDEVAPRRAYHSRDSRNLPYMFDNLEPHSTYVFRVCACSDFTKRCGNWSGEMQAATLDGIPGRPANVSVHCASSWINLTWQPPIKPNAEIKGYTMELTGNATYRDRYGTIKEAMWGPLTKFKTNDSRSVRFEELQPNTNYTVRLSAMTRTRRRGDEETRYCATAPAPPDAPPRPRWRKILENDRYMFTMYLPRISERNGPICCYRVYMVRLLPHSDWSNLPPARDISVLQYEEAHAVQPMLGAYITDVFSNDRFPSDSEVILGDGRSIFDKADPALARPACKRCLRRPRKPLDAPAGPARAPTAAPTPTPTPTAAPAPTPTTRDDLFDDELDTTADPDVVERRERRSYVEVDRDYMKNPMMMDKLVDEEQDWEEVVVKDGHLDPAANYTLFVELIPGSERDEPVYSEYVNVLTPAAAPRPSAHNTTLEVALLATCAVAGLVVAVMVGVCVAQARSSRKLPHAHLEMNPLQAALRYVVGHIGRQQLGGAAPPDMPPIPVDQLPAAYAERQADSDYGFQKEFELLQMLPECFPDRTTHASEARENQAKNRYPDIKAYDQTRVKLSPIDGVPGSDYINANYVMGYKERKKFICAQGPTDTTVNDFWRMIWEHGLELIVMLTNLEEYSKVKCSKYWPDEVRGTRAFGAITVHHVSEKRYSDYIVRELRISKQPLNSDGQPIVENNGVAKRNGECGAGGAGDASAPTSPPGKAESRLVRQYHFLMWKDFAAPEHPHSILKFIKRVNEAWSCGVCRSVVVHCSAGVGRTGTLVALDWLLEQLRDAAAVAVFACVAELRAQRNFLVQSLKQYVFVYRALVEYAHFGDTEIPASKLKSTIDRLRSTPEGSDKSLMEMEFEKLAAPPLAEAGKSCAAGGGEELRARNRSPDCLPYDRNRVILAPLPNRDYSTYINASFIEGYDNSEGFIITQDPLPNTIMDFWRMVSEHNVSTIVMLSELGEGKCPRYWDDGTVQYEHIAVEYEESESCPYYTRRHFTVTNSKSGEWCGVRQLQYHGWPTAAGHVPEVTRGLCELAELAAPCPAPAPPPPAPQPAPPRPVLVHCQYGTERSALFVALCVLACQLRLERRVDVSCVARKLRAQRAHTIDTVLQYEFLHRAILNYAELHNLLDDS